MKKLKKLSANQFLCLLLAFWTILNIIQAIFTDLTSDEAYYWVCSQVLDWGYYDHPPFFAWLIKPSVLLFGDTHLGVRLFSLLCQPIYLYLFWTLVRQFNYTKKGALLYFCIAFSIPLLQLYGWIITPDTPLLISTAVLLWSYRRFLESQNQWSARAIIDIFLVGISIAAIGYAKYHGLLVVGLLVLSNIKLLLQPKSYLVLAIASLLFLPHIMWQVDHNWDSLSYHLAERVSPFEINNVIEYIINLIATFNPFLLPLFLLFLWKNKKSDNNAQQKFEQALSFQTWGFLLFFLISTRNNHIQPQWLITLVFPMIYFVYKAAANRTNLTRYIKKVTVFILAISLTARIFVMVYDGDLIKLEICKSEQEYNDLAKKIDYLPLITNGSYRVSGKYEFYTGVKSYAKPNIYIRSSQYQYIDFESDLYHKPIAIEISDSAHHTMTKAEIKEKFITAPVWLHNPVVDTISDFVPVRNVKVEAILPAKTISGSTIPLDISITNPYQWSIPLKGEGKHDLVVFFKNPKHIFQIEIPINDKEIPPYTRILVNANIDIPSHIATDIYNVGFTLVRYPYTPWYNSEVKKIHIVNAKTKQ